MEPSPTPETDPGNAPRERTAGGPVRIGDYVLLERIGAGGFGVVHRAWQLSQQRFVAVKMMHDGATVDAGHFLREARTAARLSHPSIVPIYEIGEEAGRHYLAMKLIRGRALNGVRLEPRRAVVLMCQAIDAIDHAHRSGIVHRDLKPHNLLLEDDGHVWVSDFGLARSTDGGSTITAVRGVMGTPAYMPPEQARGQRCDERSDVYSLGATLYELLTGQPPFDAKLDLVVLIMRVLSEPPVPLRRLAPELPPDLETIVGKAMAKNPAERYQSARELGDDLARYLTGERIVARPPGLLRQGAGWMRRHPVVTTIFGCILALGLGAGLHSIRLKRQLAETTIAQANALGAAGQWQAARARYAAAERAFGQIGVTSAAPGLGLLDAHRHAPPPVLVLPGHEGTVRALAFFPDGRRALSGGEDSTLRLWDLPLGRQSRTFLGHRGPITCLALSRDGRIAVSGGEDETLRLWDTTSGRQLRAIETHGRVLKVALSPDGRRVLSRTHAGRVQLWDAETGRELRAFDTVPRRILAVAFSPDGRLALTGARANENRVMDAHASVWDVETGREVQSFRPFSAEVESMTFSSDGRRVLTAGYARMVVLWDVETGLKLLSIKGHLHGLMGALFSPRDRMIVSGGRDNVVKLWDGDTGHPVRTLEIGDSVLALAVSPDGKFILTGGHDRTLKLWDLTVAEEARTFSGHQGVVAAVALSPDARLAVSAGSDKRIKLWDVATGREIRSFDNGASVHGLAMSPDGRHAVSVGLGSTIRMWDLYAGREVRTFPEETGTLRSAAFSPDGRLLLTGGMRAIKLWEANTGRLLRSWKPAREVRSVAISSDGGRAFWGSFDGTATLWDLRADRELKVLRTNPPAEIGAIALSPDGRLAATGDEAKLVRLWDLRSGRAIRVLEGHVGDVRALSFSSDGRALFSASRDWSLRVWDVESGSELHAFTWTRDAIRSLAASRDGRFVLAGADDGSISVWDFAYLHDYDRLAKELSRGMTTLRTAPDDPAALAQVGAWYAFRGVSGWAIDLLGRAEAGGTPVSPLVMARAHWREGDFTAARRELQRARTLGEAPAEYLDLLIGSIGRSDQADRLTELSIRDGRVRLSFLGIRSRNTPPPGGGIAVVSVIDDTPAESAGLRVGDVLLRIDDQPIESDTSLAIYLASRPAGTTVALTFLRGGVQRRTEATFDQRPRRIWQPDAKQIREPRSGYVLQTLTPARAFSFGLDPTVQGAVVTNTGAHPPETVARTLRFEDVIVSVGGKSVSTAEQAIDVLATVPLQSWDSHLQIVRPAAVR